MGGANQEERREHGLSRSFHRYDGGRTFHKFRSANGGNDRYWHNASFRCGAKVQTLLEVKRTCRERREHTDATRLTHCVISRPILL